MASQSRQIIKDNKLDNVITVIQSKVEDIKELPDGCEKVCALRYWHTHAADRVRLVGRRHHLRVDGLLPLLRVDAQHRARRA